MRTHDPIPKGLRYLYARGILYWWICHLADRFDRG